MPITSTLYAIKSLLVDLPMPGQLPSMAAYITPPDPNVETDIPTAYVWPTQGGEDRENDGGKKVGAIPRNSGPGTPSGVKNISHDIDVYVVWMASNDEPDIDCLFPGVVDAVMAAFRFSTDPATATDPYTGEQSTLVDIGEDMSYRITLRSLIEQAYNRYDALVGLSVLEIIRA
jgi:hypothetical protein